MTMEARGLWLLAVVLALGISSSSAQYVGLCEYQSRNGGLGAVGTWDAGTGHRRSRLGGFLGT